MCRRGRRSGGEDVYVDVLLQKAVYGESRADSVRQLQCMYDGERPTGPTGFMGYRCAERPSLTTVRNLHARSWA